MTSRCPETQNGVRCILAAGHTVQHTTGPLAPQPAARPGRRGLWIIGCAGLLTIGIILVAVAAYGMSRGLSNGFVVMNASGGAIDSFHAFTTGPTTTVTFQAARGVDLSDGPRLACQIVRPAIATTDWAQARWTIVNRAGDVIASDETTCP